MKLRSTLLLSSLCLFASVAATGRAANLDLSGNYTYSTQNSQTSVILTADRVDNKTTGGISGTVRLELWAFSSPYSGGSQTGYRLATHSLGQISGGFAKVNISSGTLPLTLPPTGTWYLSLLVTEYTGGTANDGYVTRDYGNFAQTLVVSGGGGGGGAGGGGGGASNLEFSGNYSWEELSASTAIIRVDRITNNNSGGTSGSLRLEIWATTSAYTGGSISGYKLAQHSLNPLNGGSSWVNVSSGTVAYSPPPTGTWYVTLVLSEYTAAANNDGYTIRDYGSFPNRLTIGSGGAGGGGSSGSSNLQINGQSTYTPGGGNTTVVLDVAEVRNSATSGRSGSLRLELWAMSSVYAGGGATGYKLAQHSLNPLNAGFAYTNITSGTIAFTPPPTGTWYVTLILTEYDGSNLNDGYVERDYSNFPNPMVIGGSGGGGSGGGGSGGGGSGGGTQTSSPISAGSIHSMFIKSDGSLWATGGNAYGQLGNGNTTAQSTPVQIATGVRSVSAGGAHTLFIKNDNTLWAVGQNYHGQLGVGNTTDRSTPANIAASVLAASAGAGHTAFIRTDGSLWTCGDNTMGQIGDGTVRTVRNTPVNIARSVTAVSAGAGFTAFIRSDGTLWVTGRSPTLGLIVISDSTTIKTPIQIATNVASLSAGRSHLMFIKNDGTLWGLGENDYGQIGAGGYNETSPVLVASGVASVSAGSMNTLFIKNDGTLWGCGLNFNGELAGSNTIERPVPVQVLTNIASVSTGSSHTLFTRKDGTFWSVGNNEFGQLGLGHRNNQTAPMQVFAAGSGGSGGSGGGGSGGVSSPAQTQRVSPGQTATFSATIPNGGAFSLGARWQFNGANTNSFGGGISISNVQSAQTGLYVVVDSATGQPLADPMILGLATTAKVVGSGTEVGANIVHPNGNTFDQVLPAAAAITITADANQVTRTSFLDLDDDIVQVEFSGAGTLSLNLRYPSGPGLPAKYNQSVSYMKGVAGIVITGANETTNVSVFSVGRATAVNQALFKAGTTYGGIADIAYIAISSTNGRFGGIRAANASFLTVEGPTGIYAPGVQFSGPVFVGNISAADGATPYLMLGSAGDVRVTGGSMQQLNGRPVQVSGITQLKFVAGQDSHGNLFPARTNLGSYLQGGTNVTSQIVVNPTP